MATILMTGITGTVGNPLAALLLERGHTIVAVVRNAQSRELELRTQLGLSVEADKRLFVIPGDIVEGIDTSQLTYWSGGIDTVLHIAGSTKFNETDEREVERTNVEGTEGMLRLAEELGIPHFHHMSTVYVGGDATEFSERDIPAEANARNDYERSKVVAEARVREFPGSFSIFRIPIVVGDSETGKTISFTGYYGFLALFWQLYKSLEAKWRTDRSSCEADGIHVVNKRVDIPLFVSCSRVGPLNCVPVNWVARKVTDLLETGQEGTFHLVHPNPPRVMDTMVSSLQHLGFSAQAASSARPDFPGITCGAEPDGSQKRLVKALQGRIRRQVEPYVHCISKDVEGFNAEFTNATLSAAGKDCSPPPDVNRELIARLLDYAMERNFGRS